MGAGAKEIIPTIKAILWFNWLRSISLIVVPLPWRIRIFPSALDSVLHKPNGSIPPYGFGAY
ncbi:Uncharacterised protein [Klebsiella pneumoniae]|nr:Uncharacterised protein [Klebsiella pneumoniae]